MKFMNITYKTDYPPKITDVIRLYEAARLPRPTKDIERIREIFDSSPLIVTAWDGKDLIGLARSLTDFRWACYLSDLAVDPKYQKLGIGRKLVETTKECLGDEAMLLLLSVPDAMEYYPKIGFEPIDNGFIIKRTK